MMLTTKKALSAYGTVHFEARIMNAKPTELVVILFDGAIDSIAQAQHAMDNQQTAEKSILISKALNIISAGLQGHLNYKADGPLAHNLSALYDYCCEQLLRANFDNRSAPLEEVRRLLSELRLAWSLVLQHKAN